MKITLEQMLKLAIFRPDVDYNGDLVTYYIDCYKDKYFLTVNNKDLVLRHQNGNVFNDKENKDGFDLTTDEIMYVLNS